MNIMTAAFFMRRVPEHSAFAGIKVSDADAVVRDMPMPVLGVTHGKHKEFENRFGHKRIAAGQWEAKK